MSRSTAGSGAVTAVVADVVASLVVGTTAAVLPAGSLEWADRGLVFVFFFVGSLMVTLLPAVGLGALVGATGGVVAAVVFLIFERSVRFDPA